MFDLGFVSMLNGFRASRGVWPYGVNDTTVSVILVDQFVGAILDTEGLGPLERPLERPPPLEGGVAIVADERGP